MTPRAAARRGLRPLLLLLLWILTMPPCAARRGWRSPSRARIRRPVRFRGGGGVAAAFAVSSAARVVRNRPRRQTRRPLVLPQQQPQQEQRHSRPRASSLFAPSPHRLPPFLCGGDDDDSCARSSSSSSSSSSSYWSDDPFHIVHHRRNLVLLALSSSSSANDVEVEEEEIGDEQDVAESDEENGNEHDVVEFDEENAGEQDVVESVYSAKQQQQQLLFQQQRGQSPLWSSMVWRNSSKEKPTRWWMRREKRDVASSTSTVARPSSSSAAAAASADGDDDSQDHLVPSYRTLLTFCAGTVAIWLSEPLLSLVDTTVVGLSSSSSSSATTLLHLAALGPATVLTDLSLYATYFVALATAVQLAAAHRAQEWRQCQQVTSRGLGVALAAGTAVAAALWYAGPTALRAVIRTAGPLPLQQQLQQQQMVAGAARYCAIRSAAAPAAVVGMVAQAVCLATVDVATPVRAVLTALAVNVAGDVLLRRHHLAGVAAATAASTAASSAVLVVAVVRKMNAWRVLELRQLLPPSDAVGTTTTSSSQKENPSSDDITNDSPAPMNTTTNIATNANQVPTAVVPYVSLPDRRELWNLVRLSWPLAFNMWAKMACYFALTVKAADFGATAMASHNILLRVFFLFACLGDALGQAAQSFLPAALYPVRRHRELRRIGQRLAVVAVGVAGVSFAASRFVLLRCAMLVTSDPSVLSSLRDTSLWMALALALHPLAVSISGTVIATRNFRNLVRVYAVTVLSHFAVLARATSLAQVWQALVLFQLVRLANYIVWSKFTPAQPTTAAIVV